MMNKIKLTVLAALALALAGCGLKGPLTLPQDEQNSAQVVQP